LCHFGAFPEPRLLEVGPFSLSPRKALCRWSHFSHVQSGLLSIAEFVQLGGKVDQVDDLSQIFQTLRSAKHSPAKEHEEIVNLNVGGAAFTTTRTTLCSVPGSVLEAMFSGRHGNAALCTQDGTYVIDRPGTHFQHILNFLRCKAVVSLPRETTEQEALALEADFYLLHFLSRAIKMPKTDLFECLSDEVACIWEREEQMRLMYRTNTADGHLTLHEGLVPMFSPDGGMLTLPLKYEPPTNAVSTSIAMQIRGKNEDEKMEMGQAVSVGTLDEFRSNFNREHANVLHRLQDILAQEPVLIAGGSVLQALTSGPGLSSFWGTYESDLDLFLYANSPEEANRISQRIFYALAVDHERWVIVRSSGVITMHRWQDADWKSTVEQKVQIVLRLYESPAEVLVGFDCDCCCCGYDGNEVWVTPRAILAIRSNVNILNPLHAWPNRSSYEFRLAKYASRGWAVAVMGLNKNLVDYDRIHESPLDKLQGLARFVKVSLAVQKDCSVFARRPLEAYDLKWQVVQEMKACECIIAGLDSSYSENAIEAVIIPRVYGNGQEPQASMWHIGAGGGRVSCFPTSSLIRDGAWAAIEDATGSAAAVERVPDRLIDAWQTDKRSREYLNAQCMDKFSLDNQYYNHAYKNVGED